MMTPTEALTAHGWHPQGAGMIHGGTRAHDGELYVATLTRRPGLRYWRATIARCADPADLLADTRHTDPDRAVLAAMVLAGMYTPGAS